MWEFCLSTNKVHIASFIYQTLKSQTGEIEVVLTCYEQFGVYNIMLACAEEERVRLSVLIERCVIKVICNFYKENYLDEHLHLPTHEKISLTAFKKALINFDKETDFYIISKNLTLKNNLNLDSFYYFKLIALRDKWKELIMLANDNSDYLIGDDAFFDLLKFLIDNLEITEDEISVFQKDNGYFIKTRENNEHENVVDFEELSKESLVSTLIELSPKKINFYCDSDDTTVNFLSKIFEERVNINYNKSLKKLDNYSSIFK